MLRSGTGPGGPDLSSSDLSYLNEWEPMPGLDMGRRYDNAPIVQAILEFHVLTPAELKVDALSGLDFGEGYEDSKSMYQIEGEFAFAEGAVTTEARQDQVGFAFTRADGSRTVQAGKLKFTFIWTGEYTEWSEFSAEAEAAWLIYRQVAEPRVLQGIGVRFVNHIQLPEKAVEIKDYLRASVDVPSHLPQVVNSMFFQVEIPMPQQRAQATITSAVLADQSPGGALLLDIDVKTPVGLSTEDETFDSTVRTTLDRLRLAKNFVFEACITDATRGVIG